MTLDRCLGETLRNLSTYFLLGCVVLLPIHLVHSFAFRNVIEVRELHSDIEEFPPARQVRGVGTQQLDRARISFWTLSVLELALIPLGARAARGIIAADRSGRLPSVLEGLRAIRHPPESSAWAQGAGGVVAGTAVIGVAAGWLLESGGNLVVQMMPDRSEFAGVALMQTSARALGAAFVIVALALARSGATPRTRTPELY